MDLLDQETILGIVRHVLTTLAGVAIAHGYLSNSDAQTIIGGLVCFAGVMWSIYQKHQAAQKLAAAKGQ